MDDQNLKDQQREAADNKMIEDAFNEVLKIYLASRHRRKVDIINKAFNFARQAHKGVRRLSGEPYIMHPIAVARIAVEEMGLGSTSICAALLHDVVEDTDYTVEDISNIFGERIAHIVDGLTKISGGIFGDRASAQAENFKKLLLTMSDDIRVILIKICDRLHNMRTLASQPANKQYKIAGETMYIYAPLANRLGLNKIKTELEDLSFKYEHPDEYNYIKNKLADTQAQRDTLFAKFTGPIREALDRMGIQYELKARVKSPYSIWNKMQNKHVTFEEIYDILAVRIIYTPKVRSEEINECFKIYVAISQIYKSHPDRLRDWVNHPKANGYQALHVTLMSKQGKWIEVQIRSDHMDEVAEQGFAAHWKYKEGDNENVDDDSELNNWLSTIKEILDDPQPDAMDFLDTIKLNLFATEIIVFTPKGDLVTLPKDASVLDLAYHLHTEIGSHCIAGKVNHRLVPISYKLQSGDQVEVLTSKTQKPQAEWVGFVATAKAKTRIEASLKRERKAVVEKGMAIIEKTIADNSLEAESNILITKMMGHFNIVTREDLYFAVGNGNIELPENIVKTLIKKQSSGILNRIWPFSSKNKKPEDEVTEVNEEGKTESKSKINTKKIYVLHTENGVQNYLIAPCCNPIPGDDVLGFIDDNDNVIVHSMDCPTANRLKSNYGNRILATRWEESPLITMFSATITIEGIDRMGILQELIHEISTNMAINIRKLNIEATEGVFTCELVVMVSDAKIVNRLCKQIKKIDGVKSTARTN